MIRARMFLFVVLPFVSAISANSSPVDEFNTGNKYYEQKNYDSAVAVYQQLVRQGMESSPLYYNLGNACFRSGDLGHAMLYYLRAQRLDPNDPDIAANLEFARRFTSVQMEGVQLNPVSSLFESIVAPYHLSTLAWASSGCFILLFVFLIARLGFASRGAIVRAGIWTTFLLLLSSSLLTTVKYHHDYLTRRAVIIAEESIVHTGPSELSEKELDAAPGLVVEIIAESGDYYNVLFENKRRGWILRSLVAVV